MPTHCNVVILPFSLAGKRILVTGGSSGLGRASCQMIARCGGTVLATGRDPARLESTLASLLPPQPAPLPDASPAAAATRQASSTPSQTPSAATGSHPDPEREHRCHVADLTDSDAVAALAEQAGPVDGLVLAAGIAQVAPLRYTTPKVLRRILSINIESRLNLCQSLATRRQFLDGGSIVFISSLSVHEGVKGHAAYAATMAANEGASRALAAEFVGRQIRCNVVAPGLVKTPVLDDGEITDAQRAVMAARYPLGLGEPDDVASAVVYLLAPASRWLTGQVLRLDGGYTLDA